VVVKTAGRLNKAKSFIDSGKEKSFKELPKPKSAVILK